MIGTPDIKHFFVHQITPKSLPKALPAPRLLCESFFTSYKALPCRVCLFLPPMYQAPDLNHTKSNHPHLTLSPPHRHSRQKKMIQGADEAAAASGGGDDGISCTLCGQRKPETEFSRQQLSRPSKEVCKQCLMAEGAVADPPSRIAPAAGEGVVRCVACCRVKSTSAFGVNQLRRRAGIERCMSCVEDGIGDVVRCKDCGAEKPFTDFSKKQLACRPGRARCKACVASG